MSEIDKLREQVTELQQRGTELVEENRRLRASLRYRADGPDQHRQADVVDFFRIAQQEVGTSPHVPSAERLRTHLHIDAEEFFEKLEACEAWPGFVETARRFVAEAINTTKNVDLVALADACIDQLYTTEGILVACGIESAPLWNEVQRSNMAKDGGPVVDGKLRKPAGWTPPDIAGELRKQGWTP